MFLRYYGLHEQPFGMTPDPRFLYLSSSHREALASLIYGIESGRGFVSLIAEPGMGKTTVLFQLMERLRSCARTVFLFQTQGTTREFLSNLIADLGLDPGDGDIASLQRQLNEILIQEAQMGRQFVLVIDEAQNLDDSVLESVRMLSNFETSRKKLIQIVLSGQPPLEDKLARPELEQLRQRVSIMCQLSPFSEDETIDYVAHRLRLAGYEGRNLLTSEALSLIAELSGGIPRNINNICFHALSLGYAKGQKRIDCEIIEEVLSDLKLDVIENPSVHPSAQNARNRRPGAGLEDVALDRGGHGDRERAVIRGAGRTSSSFRRVGVTRQGRRGNADARWMIRVVTLLMMVLAGELFWAYMPAGAPSGVFAQFVDNTVGRAKQVVTQYNPLRTSNPLASSELQPTVVRPDVHSNNIPESYGENTHRPTGSTNIESVDTNPTGAGNAEAIAATGEANAQSTVAGAVPVPVKADRKGPDNPLTDQFRSSEQIPKGTIVIESNIAGSAITINGRTAPEWQTPHMFDLPQGTYRISISQAGYSTWFKVVHVAPGKKRWVTAELHLPRGVVIIDTEPPGMQVFIDGKSYGPSEVDATLSAGTHTYKVISPGGKRPLEGSFVLKPGDILTRKIRWLPSADQPNAGIRSDSQELRNKGNSLMGRGKS